MSVSSAVNACSGARCSHEANVSLFCSPCTVDDVLTSPSLSPIQSSQQQIPVYSLTSLVARLPDPSLQNLEQVENAIRNMARTAAGRERTATNIVKSDFVQKLIAIHREAEDLESLDDLHALCRVMQSIREWRAPLLAS